MSKPNSYQRRLNDTFAPPPTHTHTRTHSRIVRRLDPSKDKYVLDSLACFFADPAKAIEKSMLGSARLHFGCRAQAWDRFYTNFQSRYVAISQLNDELAQRAAVELSAYLAFFGMFTKGTQLLSTNSLFFEQVVISLINTAQRLSLRPYQTNFTQRQVACLITAVKTGLTVAKKSLLVPVRVTDTLITKILLGTFACLPAFDSFYRVGVKTLYTYAGYINLPLSLVQFPHKLGTDIGEFLQWSYSRQVIDQFSKWIPFELVAYPFEKTKTHVMPYPIMRSIDLLLWTVGKTVISTKESHKVLPN